MPNTGALAQGGDDSNLGPLDLIAQDRKRDKEQHKAPRPLLKFDTPGIVCQHADVGCCPKCAPTTMHHTRLRMRHPLPKQTIRKMYDAATPARSKMKRASSLSRRSTTTQTKREA